LPVQVGVIGVGYLGRHHARVYAELRETELVAVTDLDFNKAREIADLYGCRAVADYRELLHLCEAVSIVTPTTTHHGIAFDCLRAGKDVLIEKPITEKVEEAKELIGEAERSHRILQVGHLERYNPAVVAASGMIRRPGFVECERFSPFLGRATDVDVTFDLMIHDIDIVLGLVKSELREIRAVGESLITDKIDVAKAWLQFENGCVALVAASRVANEKKRVLTAFQNDGYVSVDYQKQEVIRCLKNGSGLATNVLKPQNREPLKEELRDFAGCVRTRKRPAVSGIEATEALEVILKITEMIKGLRNQRAGLAADADIGLRPEGLKK